MDYIKILTKQEKVQVEEINSVINIKAAVLGGISKAILAYLVWLHRYYFKIKNLHH